MAKEPRVPKATENKAKDVENPDKRNELLVQFAILQLQRETLVQQLRMIEQRMANIRNQLSRQGKPTEKPAKKGPKKK